MTGPTSTGNDERTLELSILADSIVAASYENDLKTLFSFIVSEDIARGQNALAMAEALIEERRGHS